MCMQQIREQRSEGKQFVVMRKANVPRTAPNPPIIAEVKTGVQEPVLSTQTIDAETAIGRSIYLLSDAEENI